MCQLCVVLQVGDSCFVPSFPSAAGACRSLRELEIRGGRLAASNMAAMAPLRLTSLVLNDCQLDSLPHGRFLLGLRR